MGKLTDVDFGGVLFQGDVDCMKFLFIGEDKYAVVGGVYIKGAEELLDFFELDLPVDEARFVTVAKEDEDGDVLYGSNFITIPTDTVYTCDDVTGPIVEIFNYFETSGGQAAIVFSSDPVNCGDFDSKKECRKSKDCNGILIKGLVYQASADQLLNLSTVESLSKDEAATLQDMANSSNSADPKVKMLMSGMVAGLFFALWL